MKCWSCETPLEDGGVRQGVRGSSPGKPEGRTIPRESANARDVAVANCPSCGKLQPPRTGDYFEYLGIPRAFHLDSEALSEIMRDRSRKLHPDRFARAEPRERTLSLQHTTLLNDAVRTLRDPQRRAEYLLGLHGLKAGANDRERAKMDPEFLMEMMEQREAVADARAARDEAALAKIGEGARKERERLMAEAEAKFSQWETRPEDRTPLEEVVGILDKVRYFEQMVAEAAGQPIHH